MRLKTKTKPTKTTPIKLKSSNLVSMYTGNASVIKSRGDDKFLYHHNLTSSHAALFPMALSPNLQVLFTNFKTGINFLLFT